MNDLTVGDLVKLKSGSPELTVNVDLTDDIVAVYFNELKNQFETFKLSKDAVIKVEKDGLGE